MLNVSPLLCLVFLQQIEQSRLTPLTDSGRIPRRPVYPPRQFDQDAMGFRSRARRSVTISQGSWSARARHPRLVFLPLSLCSLSV